jgi:hypothetical protein
LAEVTSVRDRKAEKDEKEKLLILGIIYFTLLIFSFPSQLLQVTITCNLPRKRKKDEEEREKAQGC